MKTKPNYNKAKNMAYKSLEHHGINDFPIDILSVIQTYDDIKVITYTEMAKKRHCSLEEVIRINSSEDGVIHYSPKRDKYIIAYNDTVEVKERIYWTLAHEFGHYILGHHKETNRYSLARNEFNENEYDAHEKEANFFSRFFISPPPLIIEANLNDHNKVMDFFGVSFTAAVNTLKYIKNSYKKGYRIPLPARMSMHFKPFIEKVIFGKTCLDCNSFFLSKKQSNYCGICSGQHLENSSKGENIFMKYSSIELNEIGRAKTCPRCGSEHVKGQYCNVCDTYLFNKCTGIEELRENIDILWHTHTEGCGEILPGYARYCHKCGSLSTFYVDDLLKPWQEEHKKAVEVSDADLPF